MSKIIYTCFRDAKPEVFSKNQYARLSKRLEPDNIIYPSPKIIEGKGISVAIFNSNDSNLINQESICLGQLINPKKDWWKPKSEVPDGTYAIFRSDEEFVELLTDTVSTRTIWYYFDNDLFIASTSQRAIVFFLKSFQFNYKTIPWMLATGTLGYGHAWDSRLKVMPGNSSVLLNRFDWSITVNSVECQFSTIQKSVKEHQEELTSALCDTFKSLDLDYEKWILPLSGGYDSRSILCLLKDVDNLKCVTWGLEKSQFQKTNDAYIARKLAEHFGKKHTYLHTDISTEPVENLVKRFLVCGEGRIDDISAYMDGFNIWKKFYENGIHGIIRGDEAFGCYPVISNFQVQLLGNFLQLMDYRNLKSISDLGIHDHEIPDIFRRKKGETLESWRDRLDFIYIVPNVYAALNDLKLSFVEVVNPLLTNRILTVVKGLPDKLRTNKSLFKKIVDNMSPDIEYAKHMAIYYPGKILKNENMNIFIQDELRTNDARSILPRDFIEYTLKRTASGEVDYSDREKSVKNIIKYLLPKSIQSLFKSTINKPKMDFNVLAFRSYLIIAMHKLLNEDSRVL